MSSDQQKTTGRSSLEIPFAIGMGVVFVIAAVSLYANANFEPRMAREIRDMEQMLGDAFKPTSNPDLAPAADGDPAR